MKRRSFVKESIARVLVVASPALLAGVVHAAGGGTMAVTTTLTTTVTTTADGWSCKKLYGTATKCENKDSAGYWHCTCDDNQGDAICSDENTAGGAWVWCRYSDNP